MAKLNSQILSIEALDNILSIYKTDTINNISRLSLTSEFLYLYLQSLTTKLLSDRTGMYKVLDSLNVSFVGKNIESPINTVFITSNAIEDVCDGCDIVPSDIDELITDKIQVSFNSYVYKLEEEIDEYSVAVKIFKGSNPEVVLDNPEDNSWSLLTTLICKQPNFNKAIQIHDEFKRRFISGKVIENYFVDLCLPFISKESGELLTYDEFLTICEDNLVFAYEFLLYFVDLSYSGNLKKKR